MNRIGQKLALAFGVVLTATSVQAATITYDFTVSVDSGPLLGNEYSGVLSFDDSGLSGSGEEFLAVDNLEFSFEGVDYTETDGTPEVLFFNGDFLGLSWSADDFSFIPGFFELSEAYFAYDVDSGAGAGDISYMLFDDTTTPEPTGVVSLLALGIFGLGSLVKQKQ